MPISYADKAWEAIIAKHEEMLQKGYRLSSRSTRYKNDNGSLCIVKYYKGSDPTRHVFHIYASENLKGQMEVRLEGPFEDSGDQYWDEMWERDLREGNGLITDTFHHYTVHEDKPNPGWGDGHGGSKFIFELTDDTFARRLASQHPKLAITFDGAKWFLTSRNVWSQDRIPLKHQGPAKFAPNCILLPFGEFDLLQK